MTLGLLEPGKRELQHAVPLVVTTTDPHLARRIGDALHHAYKGELEYRYNKQDKLLRVSWSR